MSKLIFNPFGTKTVNEIKLIHGNPTNLNDFNNIKYSWSNEIYKQMMANFWVPEEINLGQDKKDYPNLSESEKRALGKTLSFLIFLDSIQSINPQKISDYITAPEVSLLLTIQAFQEQLHSKSYAYILDTVFDADERDEILYTWSHDKVLLDRISYIADNFNKFNENPNDETFLDAVISTYILEGIYFYTAFSFFYNLARNGKMPGLAQEIRYINRDENTHLWIFKNIIKHLRSDHSELFTQERIDRFEQMIRKGAEIEKEWSDYIIQDIPSLKSSQVKSYIDYLCDLRLSAIGYDVKAVYPDDMRWVSEYADPNFVKTDFFEAKSTAYAKSTSLVDDL